ncbi:hypothetical protein [Actinomadura macrotermitis]|uniref:Dehydratase n=1 Tax=Actinomadura macrotermitis TaxID=2585200 RepID=A0A7K0BPZ4_9ACTN|nr:hypothetical protein [Actinomadura macrotermitis]MQY03223.1 hypothetical protein [Actinomadura macrotermitis]
MPNRSTVLTGALATTALLAMMCQPAHAAPREYDYSGTAQTKITGLGADIAFTPTTAKVDADLETGEVSAVKISVPEARSNFNLFGVLPTNIKVKITQAGAFTGTLKSGTADITGAVDIQILETGHFGIPIPLPDCKTTKPAQLHLTSQGAFDPATGGTLTAKYQIPEVSWGCLFDTPIINALVGGKDNPLTIKLSAQN